MNLKRRQFLFLGTLSFFGVALWNKIHGREAVTQDKLTQDRLAIASGADDLKPQPPATPLLRFISVADTGTGDRGQYAVAEAMATYHRQNMFNVAILAGDNIYNNGEIEKIQAVFERPYQPLLKQGVKFYACLGNHDIRTANGDPQVRYPGFNMQGRRFYTFRRDPVQFFALDTNSNADWETQLAWLEKELSRSNAPWKIVFGHHPVYSSGHYGNNQTFIKQFTPLFEKYGVQLYINGHDHNYERSRPINGTTYMITGSGAGTRPVNRSEWTALSASKLSFATYEVYADRIEISAIGTDNRVFDTGTIKLRSA